MESITTLPRLFLMLLHVLGFGAIGSQCTVRHMNVHFNSADQTQMINTPFLTIAAPSNISCCYVCSQHVQCKSVSYNQLNHQCHLDTEMPNATNTADHSEYTLFWPKVAHGDDCNGTQASRCDDVTDLVCDDTSKRCRCKDDATTCTPVLLGTPCSGQINYCEVVLDAVCSMDPSPKCQCKAGSVGVDGTAKCYTVTIGQDCSFHNFHNCDQIANAECTPDTRTCVCKTGYNGEIGDTTCTA